MKDDCPICKGTGDVYEDHIPALCEACDGTGRIEGTKEELFSILRWGSGLVLFVLQTLLR